MKLTIVTPSYNQAAYLGETIASVRGQEGVDLEYFVVDGGSTDGSLAIIEKNAADIDWWVSEKDHGQSHAINKGLQRASGDVIGWINSDDRYLPGALETVADAFHQHPNIDLFYFDVRNFDTQSSRIYEHKANYAPREFFTRTCLHQPGVFWRRSLMERVGWLNESLHFVMDFDYWTRMALNGTFQQHRGVIAEFRLHDSAKTHDDPTEMYIEKNIVVRDMLVNHGADRWIEALQSLELYPDTEVQSYPITRRLAENHLTSVVALHLANNAYLAYRLGRFDQARRILKYLSDHKLHVANRVNVLRAKLIWQRIRSR